MSIISGKTSTTTTSILKSNSSRERAKNLLAKVRFETPATRNVLHVLQQVKEHQNLIEYEHFLRAIHDGRCDEDELLDIVQESRSCISLLSSHFRAYVETLIELNWQQKSDKFIEEFKSFIVDLLIAHNKYCTLIISKLVDRLIPMEDNLVQWKRGTPDDSLKPQTFHNFDLLSRILDVIPMAYDILLKQISTSFPFYKKPPEVIGGYIHNLIEFLLFKPIFQEDVISLVITKLLGVDVNIARHDIEESENKDEEDEAEEMLEKQDIKMTTEDEMENPLAETLDIGMVKILEYVKTEMHKSRTEQDKICDILFKVFETDILPTHNSHHVQFVIFYLCHFKSAILEQFLDKLWCNACNFNMAHGIRQASVGYLASFLARGKFVSMTVVKSFLRDMSKWAHSYMQRSDSGTSASIKAHTVFYSVCQAIFYVIAFRSKELTADNKSLIELQALHLQSLVTCHLNPLRVCLPAVATTFAGVTRSHQIAYCYTVLERNARRKLATIYNNESQMPDECLDTFFPFDPYLLKKSGKFITELYLHYQSMEEDQGLQANAKRSAEPDSNDEDDFICDDRKRRKTEDQEKELLFCN